MPYKYGKRTHEFLGASLFPFQSSFPRFREVFNKTIIPLALVGYEMITRLVGYLSSHIQRALVE